MDIFKFNNPIAPTKMEQGEIVNNIKSKMWIERYSQAGEFELIANANTGLREKLPIGSFISHVDTYEIMIVENHEINDNRGQETEIKITGRGFETFLENRIIGSNKIYPSSGEPTDFVLAAGLPWDQAVSLIITHTNTIVLLDDNDAIPYLEEMTNVVGTADEVERSFKRDTLYSGLINLLEAEGLGIKVIRPGPWNPITPDAPSDTLIMIHTGVDRSNEIIFSYDTGEIESADYLWSNKKVRNSAMITGKWIETVLLSLEGGYSRRMMHIDASDIDNHFTSAPTGGDLTDVLNAMNQRAVDVLAAQNDVALTKAEVSKDTNKSGYRTDFDVGDIITVSGNYSEISPMRISEYVEIEDENGKNGYPTLTAIM